jgi:hypothetical protein
MPKRKIALMLLWLALAALSVENYAVARVDLDWIVVSNHFDMWNAEKDTWEFSPHLTMNWWDAYMLTVWRLIISCLLLGALVPLFFLIFEFPLQKKF